MKLGSRACFTIWGRRELSLNFTIREIAVKNLGMQIPSTAASNFDLGQNIEETKKTVLAAGFSQVKVWN